MPKFASRRKLSKHGNMVLSDLGTTSEEVASSLAKYGLRSRDQNNTSSDLLALYLNAIMGGDKRVQSVEVSDHGARIRTGRSQAVALHLPAAVSEFMFMFDSRHFHFGAGAPPENCDGPSASSGSPPRDDDPLL